MLSLLIAQSISITGGWEKVEFESEYVQTAMHYLRSKYMKVLPEYENRNTLLAFQEAEIQIVNGYNIKLTAKLGFSQYEFSLHVSREVINVNGEAERKIKLTGVHMKNSNEEEGMIGGWRIQENGYEPKLINKVFGVYSAEKGINSKLSEVIFVRTQVVAGLNLHIVFEDSEGETHSIIAYIDVGQKVHIKYDSTF